MADDGLACAIGSGDSVDHLDGVFKVAFESGNAECVERAGGVDWYCGVLALSNELVAVEGANDISAVFAGDVVMGTCDEFFVFVEVVAGSEATEVIERFECFTEGVNFVVAFPAGLGAKDVEALAKGFVGIFGDAGVDIGGDIGDDTGEEFFVDPYSAVDGVVAIIKRMGDEPCGVGQDSGALGFGKFEGLDGGPFPGFGIEVIGADVAVVSGFDASERNAACEGAFEFGFFLREKVFALAFDGGDFGRDKSGICPVLWFFENAGLAFGDFVADALLIVGFEVSDEAIMAVDLGLVVAVVEDKDVIGGEELFEDIPVFSEYGFDEIVGVFDEGAWIVP